MTSGAHIMLFGVSFATMVNRSPAAIICLRKRLADHRWRFPVSKLSIWRTAGCFQSRRAMAIPMSVVTRMNIIVAVMSALNTGIDFAE